MTVNTYNDGGALTLVPQAGGEAWVEPTPIAPDSADFQIAVDENVAYYKVAGLAVVDVTREELIAFRDLINEVLSV